MFTTIVSLLIYWLVFFVTCFIVVQVMQDWFYDEIMPFAGLRVAGGSLILALLGFWLRPSYESFLTTDITWTILQAIVWFVVFIFVLQFHPTHALGLSLITMVLVSGLATLGVESMTKSSPTLPAVGERSNVPVRRSLSAPVAVDPGNAKAVEPAK